MPIPELNAIGLLPEGVHDCSLDEIQERFGRFQATDRRLRLTHRFLEFVAAARACGVISWIAVDGSYVTGIDEPNDIDMVIVVAAEHDFASPVRPDIYNVLSRRRVQRRFQFDALVAADGSMELDRHVEFFQRTRDGRVKGILRVVL